MCKGASRDMGSAVESFLVGEFTVRPPYHSLRASPPSHLFSCFDIARSPSNVIAENPHVILVTPQKLIQSRTTRLHSIVGASWAVSVF